MRLQSASAAHGGGRAPAATLAGVLGVDVSSRTEMGQHTEMRKLRGFGDANFAMLDRPQGDAVAAVPLPEVRFALDVPGELKRLCDPNLLYPGEVLYVPAASREPAPIASKAANSYVAAVPKTTVRLTFEDADGPLANEPYVVEGVGPFAEKTTDGGGVVVLELPEHVHGCRVVFPQRGIAYPAKSRPKGAHTIVTDG